MEGTYTYRQAGCQVLTKILTLVFDNRDQVWFHQLLFWVPSYGRNVSRFRVAAMPLYNYLSALLHLLSFQGLSYVGAFTRLGPKMWVWRPIRNFQGGIPGTGLSESPYLSWLWHAKAAVWSGFQVPVSDDGWVWPRCLGNRQESAEHRCFKAAKLIFNENGQVGP